LKGALATVTISDLSEQNATDGTRKVPGGENAESVDEPRDRVIRRKELRAYERRSNRNREVIPFEEIADSAGPVTLRRVIIACITQSTKEILAITRRRCGLAR
jgi:hypothetical protein